MKKFSRTRPPKKVVLALFGALVVIPVLALPPYLRAKRSERWPTAEGVITASWVSVGKFKSMDVYRGQVEFRYRVGNQDFVSTKRSFGFPHGLMKEAAQLVPDKYPKGKVVKVYYEPANPSVGVLEPGRDEEMELLYRMDLSFIAVFSLGFVATLLWYHDQESYRT